MASAAILRYPQGTVLVSDWRRADRRMAARAVADALHGVGVADTDVREDGRIAFVTRRLCKPAERELVPEPFLSV